MERINNNNYFDYEHRMKYTGSSEVKAFMECEACALAKLRGEWQEERSKAILVSSYIDAYLSDELVEFEMNNPDIFIKNGSLKAEYRQAEEVIEQMKQDEIFWKYVSGGIHQKIMTGKIAGVPIKIKMDNFYKDKAIIDEKSVASLDLIWNDKLKCKQNFVDYYQYTLQRSFISRNCKTTNRKAITIYYSSCN